MTIDEISEDKPGEKQLADEADDDVEGHRLPAVDPDFDRQRLERQTDQSDQSNDTEAHVRI